MDGIKLLTGDGDVGKHYDAVSLTWRPAREEWLCCFLGPSAAEVFPPELLPPEDLPFPPAILMMSSE